MSAVPWAGEGVRQLQKAMSDGQQNYVYKNDGQYLKYEKENGVVGQMK